jgi:uncharacterized protein YunC (DUF1805 family)
LKASGSQGTNRLLVSFNSTNPLVASAQAIQLAWADANPAPTITFLSPGSAFEGSPDLLLTVGGTNFQSGSIVLANGNALQTTFQSATQLQAVLPASVLTAIGTLNITVQNPGSPGQTSNSLGFTILDAPLNGQSSPFSYVEGSAFAGTVATFVDLNPNSQASDFTATITWGDGQSSAGVITSDGQGGFIVSGAHTYQMLGSYGFSVQIIDTIGGAATTVLGIATILDAPLDAQSVSFSGQANQAFTGIVATFTDGNPFGLLEHYIATIYWGDGSSSTGRISSDGQGGYLVTGSHAYLAAGVYSFNVDVTDTIGGATATATGTADIAGRGAELHAEITQKKNGRGVDLAVKFTGLAPGKHKAVIDWGDGRTSKIHLGKATEGSFHIRHKYGWWFAWQNRSAGANITIRILNAEGSIALETSLHIGFGDLKKPWCW